ncbi:MAG TPA: hypothetical protein VK550_16030, partial [Polyangiaceae bacterium]|nr:hypothetical protein [Polyangiaceae bacterium]
MGTPDKNVNPPSDETIRFWAGSLAKEWMRAVAKQVERLRNHDGQSWSMDIHFLLVALRRLQRAAVLATQLPAAHDAISDAIKRFEAALPGYVVMRNASEHLDEYVMSKGREVRVGRGSWVQNVRRHSLQSSSFDGTTFEWLGVYEDGPVDVFALEPASEGRRRVRLHI